MPTKYELPSSVRYVKNGDKGRWWRAARTKGQIHLGWSETRQDLLLTKNFEGIKRFYRKKNTPIHSGAIIQSLDHPDKHVWITFEDGFLWWCTVRDGITVNPSREDLQKGNYWLRCQRKWSNRSLKGKLLSIERLPGPVTRTKGFRATICEPTHWEAILRVIRGDVNADVLASSDARSRYANAIEKAVGSLVWQDFEKLIEMILRRSGWDSISARDPVREGVDIEAENPSTQERVFVQVKVSANQKSLAKYVNKFKQRRENFDHFIFAVHSPVGKLALPEGNDRNLQLWTSAQIGKLVVRLGLGEWVEDRLA